MQSSHLIFTQPGKSLQVEAADLLSCSHLDGGGPVVLGGDGHEVRGLHVAVGRVKNLLESALDVELDLVRVGVHQHVLALPVERVGLKG